MSIPTDSQPAPRAAEQRGEGGPVAGPRAFREFDEKQHHAQTASRITFVLLAILGVSVLLHYGAVITAHYLDRVSLAEALAEIFRVWIPVLSSFVGSALAFYFTQRRS